MASLTGRFNVSGDPFLSMLFPSTTLSFYDTNLNEWTAVHSSTPIFLQGQVSLLIRQIQLDNMDCEGLERVMKQAGIV